ncbi:MAG: nucleotide exchange factor GrpE [Bacteroidales bacterium]|nr:nucleotide exchange factor GrpE [Bacteroidales bacterium]
MPVENNEESGNAEETDAETAAETEVSEAEKKLLEAETKIAETNDKYVRLAAEFDNYRRRVAKEKLELIATASEDVIKGILPVLDDCYRALKVLKESDAPASAIEGTELILNKLTAFLKVKGLTMIEAQGKEFNTDDMEAVTQFPVEDKEQKGKVIDVVQDGYMLNGKVIRFAKVVVGA